MEYLPNLFNLGTYFGQSIFLDLGPMQHSLGKLDQLNRKGDTLMGMSLRVLDWKQAHVCLI